MALFKVEEYGSISIEEIQGYLARMDEELAHPQISVYPDVIASGVVRIERRASKSGLTTDIIPQKVIGMVPIAKGISLWVEPKVPVKNIDYMAKKYDGVISRDIKELRAYMVSSQSSESMRQTLSSAFLGIATEIAEQGLWHEYVRVANTNGELVGRIDVSRTIREYASRDITYKASTSYFMRTVDVAPNRIIRRALESIANDGSESSLNKRRARALLLRFVDVEPTAPQASFLKDANHAAKVTELRPSYSRGIPLAKALILDESVDLSSSDGPLLMAPLFVDMSVVFENYILHVLKQQMSDMQVESGNDRRYNVPLFKDEYRNLSPKLKTCAVNASGMSGRNAQPDILIYKSNLLVGVADVKYKPIKQSVTEGIAAKREDIEQAVTFAERYGMTSALTIHPCLKNQDAGLFYSGTIGSINVFCYRINLGSDDLNLEENRLGLAVRALVMDD